jgi:hypothetical protein
MLFHAHITPDILKSNDALVEQLYIFLNEYVPKRLIYESEDEREDCTQDTLMYLLKRFKNLDIEILDKINVEKFFYNRANSFVSGYLRKLSRKRLNEKEYIERQMKILAIDRKLKEDKKEFLNERLLKSIIESFHLEKEKLQELNILVLKKFEMLDYDVYIDNHVSNLEDHTYKALNALSYAIVDEYMLKDIQEEGEQDVEQYGTRL